MKKLFAFVGVVAALALTGFSYDAGERVPPPPRAPRHISLLIGVGNYQHAGSAKWRGMQLKNLKGPGHDVTLMRTVLRNRGFNSGPDQQVLVDAQARKNAIRQAFSWLASRATDSSDVVVIYYSGHGSWALDRDIDAIRKKDEATPADTGDRWDEGLVPWDAVDPENPEHLVLDDEIGAWLDRIGTRNVTVIVDACFSGTVTRGSPDAESETAPVARGPRPPPYVSLLSGMLEGARGIKHTLLTAATSSQKAYEQPFEGGVVSGVFTRALAQALEGAGPGTRLDELIKHVQTRVGSAQTPQVEGDRTGRIFRVGANVVVPARGYALVRPAGPRRVGLDVGIIHGVRKGAVYDVYPAGETGFQGRGLAQVMIDSVLEASSFARIVSQTRAVPASARATLSRVPPGVMALEKLTLFVHPSASAMRDSLAAIPWLALTDRPAGAMAELRRRGDGYQIQARGHEVAPLWGDVDGGRTVAAGPGSRPAYRGSYAVLCLPLRRAFSIVAMSLINNDQPPPPERLTLDIRVFPDSILRPTRTESTADTAYVGDRYKIWAWVEIPREATPASVLYLTAALSGYAASPRVLYPGEGDAQTPLPSQAFNRAILLQSGFRFTSDVDIENIKAVVNSNPYDLRKLVQELPSCPVGPRSRGRGPGADPLVVTGWTAIDRRVEILTH